MSSARIAGTQFLVRRIKDESCGRRVSHQDKFRNPKGKTLGKGSFAHFSLKKSGSPDRAKTMLKKNDS